MNLGRLIMWLLILDLTAFGVLIVLASSIEFDKLMKRIRDRRETARQIKSLREKFLEANQSATHTVTYLPPVASSSDGTIHDLPPYPPGMTEQRVQGEPWK